MPKFTVLVREVHVSHREVEAENAHEAIGLVREDEGEEIFLEYSDTLNPDTWRVDDADGNIVIDFGEYKG